MPRAGPSLDRGRSAVEISVESGRQPGAVGDLSRIHSRLQSLISQDAESNPRHSDEAEVFRERIRTFLAEQLPSDWQGIGAIADRHEADRFVATGRSTLGAHGLLGVSWPAEYGGAGLTKAEQVVLVEELARAGVPAMGYNDTFGIKMLGNTLLRWGTEAQKRYFLPRIIAGEDRWCQGFSEPGSGSDLASLSTRAVLDGDRWVIDGQKLWTSRAREANWIFLLARTNAAAPRHRGISFLLVPLDQPGVKIAHTSPVGRERVQRGLPHRGDRARRPRGGEVDGGWAVAGSLLGLERGEEAATNPILFRAELERLLAVARQRSASNDPVVRQRLADAWIRCEIMRYLGQRILTGVLAGDGSLGPEPRSPSCTGASTTTGHRSVPRRARASRLGRRGPRPPPFVSHR